MIKNSKLKIAVLAGGPGAEREVSLKSGRAVMRNINRHKYAPSFIIIGDDGKWKIGGRMMSEAEAIGRVKKEFDLVFIALHGEYGEDGTIQKLFDGKKIAYTGSGARASKLGMDKPRSFKVFIKKGLNVPDFLICGKSKGYRGGKKILERIEKKFGFPVVVKPADRGSSVGVSIVRNNKRKGMENALRLAFKYSKKIVVQKYIEGREFTGGIFDSGKKNYEIEALPPTEIIPLKRRFFDYYSKYSAGAAGEITPPDLPAGKIKAIQDLAKKAHRAIGCSGLTRADMILGQDGKFYILEINTLPGLTPTSLVPQEAGAAGISFAELLDKIIAAAIAKYDNRTKSKK